MTGERRLLIASNRGPVQIAAGPGGKQEVRRGGGGLVSGMVSALSEVGGLWVCAALNDRERVAARRAPDGHLAEAGLDTGGLDVRMLPLDPLTFGRAYNGIANSTIWFVNHLLYDSANKPVFDAGWRRLWAAYERYNGAFADALAAEAAPGAKVMVQDYHLDVCPRQLRERRRRPADRALHAHPVGAAGLLRGCCPTAVARELLTGLLGADHVGFHCAAVGRRRSCDCCARVPRRGRWTDSARYGELGRAGRSGSALHPLGTAARRDAGPGRRGGRRRPPGATCATLVGDRQGDRPGGPHRAEQEHRPRAAGLPGAAAAPGRSGAGGSCTSRTRTRPGTTSPNTASTRRRCSGSAGEIEEEFGTDDWDPVLLEVNDDYPGSLAALRLADVLLVNPIRDGMNLVAKEGLVLSERDCALVLSREAGVADGARRRRAAGQPVRRDRDRGGAARGAVDAGRRAAGAQQAAGRRGDRAAAGRVVPRTSSTRSRRADLADSAHGA